MDANVVWLASVHGRNAAWVRNLMETPTVRIKLSGRWHNAHARVHEYDESIVRRFNLYARSGPRTLGIDPALVRIELEE
jgi:F420H(2)-dependent quinone reductase